MEPWQIGHAGAKALTRYQHALHRKLPEHVEETATEHFAVVWARRVELQEGLKRLRVVVDELLPFGVARQALQNYATNQR